MIIISTLVDARAPAGLSFAVSFKKMMVLKLEKIPAAAALFLCALALFALPVKSLAAKKPAVKTPAAVAAPAVAVPAAVKQAPVFAVIEFDAKDADPEKRAQAAVQIAGGKDPEKRVRLKELLADKDARVQAVAARGLAQEGDAAAYPALSEALDGADDNARLHALEGMGLLKDNRAAGRLIALLGHANIDTRWKAAEALANFRGRNVVDALLAKAADEAEDVNIRQAAVQALVKIGDKKVVGGLKALKSPKAPALERAAQRAAAILEARKQP